jgi:hypothetical protein
MPSIAEMPRKAGPERGAPEQQMATHQCPSGTQGDTVNIDTGQRNFDTLAYMSKFRWENQVKKAELRFGGAHEWDCM